MTKPTSEERLKEIEDYYKKHHGYEICQTEELIDGIRNLLEELVEKDYRIRELEAAYDLLRPEAIRLKKELAEKDKEIEKK